MSYPGSGDPSQPAHRQYGAPPNPSDRVIPPPGYSPDSAHRPHADVVPPPTRTPRPQVFAAGGFPGGPAPGPQPATGSGGLWIVVVVLVAVALILGGVFTWLVARDDADSVVTDGSAAGAAPGFSPTGVQDPGGQNPGVTALPAGAQTCPATVPSTTGLRGSAVGSTVTSCPFAEEVRLGYMRGGSDPNPRTVVASSPVTGKRYEMDCVSSAQLVTCTGGENAVVYLF
ncbi:MAG: hypothetical protein ACOH2Q_18640 [Rhodococcus sp. (in: high G+C Gram-positive bacteria)]